MGCRRAVGIHQPGLERLRVAGGGTNAIGQPEPQIVRVDVGLPDGRIQSPGVQSRSTAFQRRAPEVGSLEVRGLKEGAWRSWRPKTTLRRLSPERSTRPRSCSERSSACSLASVCLTWEMTSTRVSFGPAQCMSVRSTTPSSRRGRAGDQPRAQRARCRIRLGVGSPFWSAVRRPVVSRG